METPWEGKTAGRRFGCFTTAQSRLGWPLYSCAYRVSDAASLLMCTVPKRLLSSNGRNCKAFISGATGRATGVGCKWRRSSAVCKYQMRRSRVAESNGRKGLFWSCRVWPLPIPLVPKSPCAKVSSSTLPCKLCAPQRASNIILSCFYTTMILLLHDNDLAFTRL